MQNDAANAYSQLRSSLHSISENKPERERGGGRERERDSKVTTSTIRRRAEARFRCGASASRLSPREIRDYESETCGIDDSIEELRTSCLEEEAIYQSRVNNV